MHNTTIDRPDDFPTVGYRAHRWQRFERDLAEWLQTPEGRFTAWCASQLVAGGPATAPDA
ncbi:MAG TPA: hypothetical protein VGM91_21630 [Conexibacter sp.]|jgi:hypothetical protein